MADWEDSLVADVLGLPEKPERDQYEALKVDFDPNAYTLVESAAKKRNMSVSSFLRWAAFSVAANDLGMNFSDFTRLDPRLQRHGASAVRRNPRGDKAGPWRIRRMI